MAPPPAKRRKRLVVLSSDDEDQSTASRKQKGKDSVKNPQPARFRTRHDLRSIENQPQSSQTTNETSVHSRRNEGRSITTFFSVTNRDTKQTRRGPSASESTGVVQPALDDGEAADTIEDFSDDEGNNGIGPTGNDTRASLDRRKRVGESNLSSPVKKETLLHNGSQKFKTQSKGTGEKTVNVNTMDHRPWAERFAPLTLDELAVHKKKVSDVRGWLENVYSGKHRKRLLILKGPAGTGKTATLKILAQVMKLEICEWKNPVGSEYSSEGYTSMSANFEDFLVRSGKYSRLEIDGIQKPSHLAMPLEIDAREIILLEEFPSTFLTTSTALQSFRGSLLQYLASSTPSMSSFYPKPTSVRITPAIMIITETRLTSTTSSNDTFTVHRLLGSDILSHPGVSVIEFNPVAPTFIKKALDMVIQKEARHSGRRRVPGPSVLLKLSEFGDVRSAIGSLEFLCVRAQDDDDWGGRVAANAKRGANAKTAMTQMETKSLEMVTQRENSLGLFHAVGKVVYNKRVDFALRAAEKPTTETPAQPPNHLPQHVRLRLPQTSVDQLIDETGTDVHTFIAALHENYAISCEGSAISDTLDGCLSALSDGDLLGSSQHGRKGMSKPASYGTTTESLRQDEIAFQLVVRGLLFALPDPVKRSSHPVGVAGKSGGKGDSYKMFYPVSMRLSREMEEMEHSIDRLHKLLETGAAPKKKSTSEVKRPNKVRETENEPEHSQQQQLPVTENDQEPFRTSLYCTKTELILERLPFITKIEQASPPPSSTYLRELETITQFHGIAVPDEDEASDNDRPQEFATSSPSKYKFKSASATVAVAATRRAGKNEVQTKEEGSQDSVGVPVENEMGKLYLSDDDIED